MGGGIPGPGPKHSASAQKKKTASNASYPSKAQAFLEVLPSEETDPRQAGPPFEPAAREEPREETAVSDADVPPALSEREVDPCNSIYLLLQE